MLRLEWMKSCHSLLLRWQLLLQYKCNLQKFCFFILFQRTSRLLYRVDISEMKLAVALFAID